MLVDPETIQRAQSGDAAAFTEIVQAYRKRILGTIFRLISRADDVEDVGQDVFVRLYYSLGQLRSAEVFEPWLYRLTVNTAYDYLRKRRRRAGVPMAEISEEQLALADAAEAAQRLGEERRRGEIRELTDRLLSEVSEEDRILLTLKEIEGLSLKELAKIYEAKENALKVRLFRARQRVQKAYDRLKKKNQV